MAKPPRIPAPEGLKGCPSCLQVKPLGEFYRSSTTLDTYGAYCKVCKRKRQVAAIGRPDLTAPDRFWAKVQKTETCWLWTGAKRHYGYGCLIVSGRTEYAHRYSLILAGVELPPGMFIDHICRVPACVNPGHLRVVTPAVNGLENNDNPWAINRRRRECKANHPFLIETTGIYADNKGRPTRVCLLCEPSRWRYAIIRPTPPSNARVWKRGWTGPKSNAFEIEDGIVMLTLDREVIAA